MIEAGSLQNNHKLLKFVIRSGNDPSSHPAFPCVHFKEEYPKRGKKKKIKSLENFPD